MVIPKTVFFMVFLCLSTELSAADRNKDMGGWKLSRETEGISIYYRWLNTDSLRTREMRAQFFIRAEIPAILRQFTKAENYLSWAVGIKECRIKIINDSSWVTYTLMDYPWPMKQKDLVTRYVVKKSRSETEIIISAEPEAFPPKEGIERMQNYTGEWKFVSAGEGNTLIDYRAVSFTKPVFPRFIQDPVIQKLFIDSFHELKYLAETQ
jgi:hypothetical protein